MRSAPLRAGIVLGAVVSILLVPPVKAAEAPAACRIIEHLRVRGYLDEAFKQAQAALGESATRRCALRELSTLRTVRAQRAARVARTLRRAGLEAAAIETLKARLATGDAPAVQKVLNQLETAANLAVAKTLLDAGFSDAATESLLEELKKAKSETDLGKVRALLRSASSRRVSVARALEDAGLHEDAQAQVKAALVLDPDATIPAELLPPDRRLPRWREWLGEIGPWVRSVGEALIVLLAAIALVLALKQLLWRLVKRRLDLGEITGDGAKEVEHALREQFARLRDHHGGTALEHVTASGTAFAVPADVSKAFPVSGILVAILDVLNRLFPGRRWHVAGAASSGAKQRGQALTMTIARRDGRVRFAETFHLTEWRWRPPADGKATSTEWHRLALPAAVWLVFQAGRRAPARFRSFRALGTRDWRSYALFAAGADVPDVVENRAQRGFARRLYLDALEVDPDNQGAALNLATLELLEAAVLNDDVRKRALRKQAEQRLKALVAQLQRRHGWRKDPLWYRAQYMLVSAQLVADGPADAAYRSALDLTAELLKRLRRIDHFLTLRRRSRALRELLRRNEGSIVAALATAAVASRLPRHASPLTPGSRVKLHRALERTPAGQVYQPASLAAYVESRCLPSARGHYNLACYYARETEPAAARAQLRLAIALGGPAIVAQARIDPDLESLDDEIEGIAEQEAGPAVEPQPVTA